MKKILIAIGFLIGFYSSFSQTFLTPRSSPTTTVQDSRLRALLNFYFPHTHGLTMNNGLDTLGMVIYEDSSSHVWYRDTVSGGGHKWSMLLKVGDAVSGVSSFNTRTGAVTLSSGDVVTALGFTPVNPNGTGFQYIAGDGSKVTFPTIPAQINITDAGLFTHSGTYPNYTFTGLTPTQQQVFTQGANLTQNNFWVTGANVLGMTGTAAFGLPTGSTSQRPSSPGTGYFRFNTDSSATETYNGSQWVKTGTGTGVTGVTSFNTRTGAVTLSSGDVTTALTFTPYNSSNPSGFISNIGGLVTAGANITITGSGTSVSPYVIVGTSSGSVFNQDSIKHRFVDTGSTARNLYPLAWDSVNRKWILVPPGTGGGGTGTVTNFSFTAANGFTGNVTNPSTVPALTVGTSITGLLFGNGTAMAAATVSTPLTYSTGTLGIQAGGTSQNGYISSTDWNTFNGKINLTSLSATSPLLYNNTTGVFSIQVANTSQNGYLSSTDWNTFNGKQAVLSNSGSGYRFFVPGATMRSFVCAGCTLDSTSNAGALTLTVTAGGSGTVTSFSAGALSPLFTTSVATATTTPALTFSLSTASANLAFGNFTGSTAVPAFGKLPLAAMATGTLNTLIGYDGSGNPSGITVGSGLLLSGGTLSSTAGGGSVTSVGLALPASVFGVSGSPVTGSGTLTGTFNTQNAGFVFISDSVSNGQVPFMRHLVVKDLPAVSPWPAEGPIGTIYNKPTWLNINDFSTTGLTTLVLSSGFINITGGATPAYTDIVRVLPYRPTQLPRFAESVTFKMLTTPAAGTVGLGIGLKTTSGAVGDFTVYVNTTNSGSSGFMTIVRSDGVNTYATGSSANTVHLNDVLVLTATFTDSLLTCNLTNLTTGVTSTPLTWTAVLNNTPNSVFTNCNFSLLPFGPATYQIQNFSITSDTYRNANIVFVGDSKTEGYRGANYSTRFGWKAGILFPHSVIYAGGSNTTASVLSQMEELTNLNGAQYVLSIGCNDVRAAVSLAQLETNYAQIVSILSGGGASVYHMVIPEDSTGGATGAGVGLTAFKNWVAATYASNYIDVWDTMSTSNVLKSVYNSGDGVHPNQAGMDAVFRADTASHFLKVISVNRRAYYRQVDNTIKYNGDSIFTFQTDKATSAINHWTSNGASTTGVTWDNGTQTIIGTTSLNPVSGSLLNVNGVIAVNGSSSGIVWADRSSSQTVPKFTMYVGSNQLRTYNNTFAKDLTREDSIGRWIFGIEKTASPPAPNAYIHIFSSDGTAGNAPMIIESGTPVSVKLQGQFNHNNGFLMFDSSATVRDTISTRSWVRNNFSSGGGGGVTTVGAFSGSSIANGASISTTTITFGPADATNPGMIKNTGSQTLGTTLTMPAPLFTSLTSSGANDSALTVDPSTGQVHRRSGTFNLKFANGLTAPTTDSVILGGTLNQVANIATAGFSVNFTGTGSVNTNGTGSVKLGMGGNMTGFVPASGLGGALTVSPFTTNDATSSGSVIGFASTAAIGATTFTATSSTTYSNAATLYVAAPIAGSNVTFSSANPVYGIFTTGNIGALHYFSSTTNPVTSPGSGAGTAGAASSSGTDLDGTITVTTGTLPGVSSVIATVTYFAAFPSASYVTLTPGNAVTAVLSGASMVYINSTTGGYTINAGTVGLTASTTYVWFYHCGGK